MGLLGAIGKAIGGQAGNVMQQADKAGEKALNDLVGAATEGSHEAQQAVETLAKAVVGPDAVAQAEQLAASATAPLSNIARAALDIMKTGRLGDHAGALVALVATEFAAIRATIDAGMQARFPIVRHGSKAYTWQQCRDNPGKLTWYIALCAVADAQRLTQAMGLPVQLPRGADAGPNVLALPTANTTILGQDPITIMIIISAIVALAPLAIDLLSGLFEGDKPPEDAPPKDVPRPVEPAGQVWESKDFLFLLGLVLAFVWFMKQSKKGGGAAAAAA